MVRNNFLYLFEIRRLQLKKNQNKIIQTLGNLLFFGILLLIIINPNAKAWMLKQLMTVGLFKAEIKNERPVNGSTTHLSFDYRDVNGSTHSIAGLKGRVVFINFWATWCPPCLAEMPSLDALYRQMKADDRVVFLFINEDENDETAKEYLAKKGYEIPLQTAAGNIPSEFFSGTLPTTIILNKEGAVAMKQEGLANYKNQAFLKQLKMLL